MNILYAQNRLKELSQEIISKGHKLTGAEAKAALAEWEECESTIKAHKAALRWAHAGAPGEDGTPPAGMGGAFVGTSVVDDGQRLAFTAKMAGGITTKMTSDGTLTEKALAPSGAAVVAQDFQPDPVALGRVPFSLLDVLPVKGHPTQEYAFLRQSTRTNAAAVVADNAVKPTSVYSVTRVEQSLQVIAHLSEPIPRFWIYDNDQLSGFIANELNYGLRLAVEAKVVADINATSGIQTQVYGSSIPTTVRKALTKLEAAGYTPASIVLTPADFETVELALSTTNAVEHMGLPFDPAQRRLYGVQVVVSTSEAAGFGHVLARDSVVVDTSDQGVGVQWSENATADSFAKNQIIARCEGRYGTSVLSPLGVVKVATA